MILSRLFTAAVFLFLPVLKGIAEEQSYSITITLAIAEDIRESVKAEGRLIVFFSLRQRPEPRTRTWPSTGNYMFAKNISALPKDGPIEISAESDLMTTADWSINQVPKGTYYVQVVWDQDRTESRIDAPGNIYSEVSEVDVDEDMVVNMSLSKIVGPREIVEHTFVKEITMKSEILSKWWGKDVILKASVLLPNSYYEKPGAKFPVRYNIAGYGGRYTHVNRLLKRKSFSD